MQNKQLREGDQTKHESLRQNAIDWHQARTYLNAAVGGVSRDESVLGSMSLTIVENLQRQQNL